MSANWNPSSSPRNRAISGRWVMRMIIMSTVAQNADSPGESCSTIRHHTRTSTGSKKCRPVFTVGPTSGNDTTGASGSSSGRSG